MGNLSSSLSRVSGESLLSGKVSVFPDTALRQLLDTFLRRGLVEP